MVAFLSFLDVAPRSAMDIVGIVLDVSFLSLADVAAVSDVNVAVSVVGVAALIVVDTAALCVKYFAYQSFVDGAALSPERCGCRREHRRCRRPERCGRHCERLECRRVERCGRRRTERRGPRRERR